jgi:tellurite resistance protein TerC
MIELAFVLVVATMLVLDLRSSKGRDPTPKTALAWSGAWFGLAALFGVCVWLTRGGDKGIEFATAYLVEQALSVDNLFVMMLVFARFAVPRSAQRRILTWGIAGVVILRGAMILAGTTLIGQFHFLTYALGGFLLLASVKLAREIAEPGPWEGPEKAPENAGLRKLLSRFLPLTDRYDGDRFTTIINGIRHATPLLLALVTIELADAVFAVDSIPAVFGVTTDRYIVFSSNLFAVLGLRSLFFALSGLLERLRFLKHGLVGVLGLVGTKMLVAAVWPAPAWLSLVLVALILSGAIVASLFAPSTDPGVSHAEGS